MMTPEERLKRAERMIVMLATAGRRARQEWGEKVNILINAQIAVEDQIKSLAESQKLTDQTLRTFIDSLHKRGNGEDLN